MQEESYDIIKEKIRDDFIRFHEEYYEKQGKTRKQFAEDLHILPQTVSDIINKKQYVTLQVILNFQIYHLPPFTWIIYEGSLKKAAQ